MINKSVTGKVPKRAKPSEGKLGRDLSKVKQMINKFDPELSKKRNYYKPVSGQNPVKVLKPKVIKYLDLYNMKYEMQNSGNFKIYIY